MIGRCVDFTFLCPGFFLVRARVAGVDVAMGTTEWQVGGNENSLVIKSRFVQYSWVAVANEHFAFLIVDWSREVSTSESW